MAPEQARGKRAAVGPAADVYALGAILYETADRPAAVPGRVGGGDGPAGDRPRPGAPVAAEPTVPRDLETICLKCLRKEPRPPLRQRRRRWPTTSAASCAGRRSRRGPRASARLARRVRRRPGLSAAVATVTVLALALAGGGRVDAVGAVGGRAGAVAATERAVDDDLTEMAGLDAGVLAGGAGGLERANGRLGDRDSADLRRRLDQGQRDLGHGQLIWKRFACA